MSILTWGTRIGALALVGVVATFAVAWRLAALMNDPGAPGGSSRDTIILDARSGEYVRISDERLGPGRHVVRAWSVQASDDVSKKTIHDLWSDYRPLWLPPGVGAYGGLRQQHVGWPALALRSGSQPAVGSRSGQLACFVYWTQSGFSTLPVVPLWPGLAIDVCVYGGAFGACVTGLSWVRRRVNRRGGGRGRGAPARALPIGVAWGTRIVTGVVVGVLATVGAAWGIALAWATPEPAGFLSTGPPPTRVTYTDPANGYAYTVDREGGLGWERSKLGGIDAFMNTPSAGATSVRPRGLPAGVMPSDEWVGYYVGWPVRTMSTNRASTWSSANLGRDVPGVFMWYGRGGSRVVPLDPVWSGFVPSVLVFAGGYVVIATRGANFRRRRREGRCIGCGYSLHGLPDGGACPECGAAVVGGA